MEPQFTPPASASDQTPPPPANKSNRKLLIGIIIAIAVVAIGALLFFLLQPKENSKGPQRATEKAVLTFGTEPQAVSYAGNVVYDACNLISLELLKKHVEKYDESLKNLGGDRLLNNPLVIDHGYIDRSLPQPLGNDNKPRSTGITVGEGDITTQHQASSFASILDSHCTYAQGKSFNTEFAQIFVAQKPTPLSEDFINYLTKLKKDGRLVKEVSGIEVFVEPPVRGSADFVVIMRKGDTVVIFSSPIQKLVEAGSDEIVAKLMTPPTGPMTVTYPKIYDKLINPCRLITADDFQRLTNLPTSAVVSETLLLTEVESKTAQRECARIEVARQGTPEISSINAILSQSRSEEVAKQRIAALRNGEKTALAPVSEEGYGDESYIKTETLISKKHYSMIMRVGSVIIEVKYDNEEGQAASEQTYKNRILPVAKTALQNFKTSQ